MLSLSHLRPPPPLSQEEGALHKPHSGGSQPGPRQEKHTTKRGFKERDPAELQQMHVFESLWMKAFLAGAFSEPQCTLITPLHSSK